MKNDLVSISGKFLPRRMVLHGIASLFGGALAPGAFAATENNCQLTESDILGPFYRFGAPFQTRLAGPDEPGDRLILTGTVFSSDCQTPLPGALIEVWQANKAGLYDTNKPGNFTEVTALHLRGILYFKQKAQYEIETIVPGR